MRVFFPLALGAVLLSYGIAFLRWMGRHAPPPNHAGPSYSPYALGTALGSVIGGIIGLCWGIAAALGWIA